MVTTPITIQLDKKAAKARAADSLKEQRKMQRLPSLRLQDLTTLQGKSRQEIMDEIGANAAARDLTPEILDSLLNDEELARRYEYKCGRHRRSAPRRYGAASVRRGSSG